MVTQPRQNRNEPTKALKPIRALTTDHIPLTSFGHDSRQAYEWLSFNIRKKLKPMKILPFIIFLLTIPFASSAQNSPSFKGVPFGVGSTTFLSLYKPGGQWGERGGVPQVTLSEARRAVVIEPPNASGIVSGQIYSATLSDSVANVEAQVVFYFAIQSEQDMKMMKSGVTRALAEKALFSEAVATFDRNLYSHILAATISRYGEPSSVKEKEKITEWDLPDLFLRLEERNQATRKTMLSIRAKTVKSLAVSSAAEQL